MLKSFIKNSKVFFKIARDFKIRYGNIDIIYVSNKNPDFEV